MITLKKTMEGYACEVYTITGDNRIRVGSAVPEVEVYEECIT